MDITEQMILRLIDANINRLREGLRVSEDICRFVLNDAALSRQQSHTLGCFAAAESDHVGPNRKGPAKP